MGQYRCENGGCAYNLSDCINETDYKCPDGQEKCPDGLCHDTGCTDVNYHGCLVGQYQCSNGMCVKDKYECIGYSMCSDPAYPYRCITGACQSSPDECPTMDRLGEVNRLLILLVNIIKYLLLSLLIKVLEQLRELKYRLMVLNKVIMNFRKFMLQK